MNLVISPFVFRLDAPDELRLSNEVVSAHWLPLDELLGADCRSWRLPSTAPKSIASRPACASTTS